MFYDNAVCDGCGQPLLEGEDVVVCPVCGTPQHRACYELNNKCVNERLHGDGFEWTNLNPPEEKSEQSYEPKIELVETPADVEGGVMPAGIPMPALDVNPSFFQNAGIDPEMEFDGIKAKEAVSYTQIGAKNYVRKFIRTNGKRHFISWNWGAFLLAPAWFFYRKVYKVGFVLLGLMVAANLLLYPTVQQIAEAYDPVFEYMETMRTGMSGSEQVDEAELEKQAAEAQKILEKFAPQITAVFMIQTVIPHVVSALIANGFYKRKMLEDIKKARNLSTDPRVVKYSILRSGGVAFLPAAAALLAETYLPEMILKAVNYFILK